MAGGAHGGFMLGHGLGVDLGRCGGCASPVGTYVREYHDDGVFAERRC